MIKVGIGTHMTYLLVDAARHRYSYRCLRNDIHYIIKGGVCVQLYNNNSNNGIIIRYIIFIYILLLLLYIRQQCADLRFETVYVFIFYYFLGNN